MCNKSYGKRVFLILHDQMSRKFKNYLNYIIFFFGDGDRTYLRSTEYFKWFGDLIYEIYINKDFYFLCADY